MWKVKKVINGEMPRELDKNTIYYYYSKGHPTPNTDGYVKFMCPICEKHHLHLPFEHGKTKDRWWHPEGVWQFDLDNEYGFVMNPSVQITHDCKGHFWFKQGNPRIY